MGDAKWRTGLEVFVNGHKYLTTTRPLDTIECFMDVIEKKAKRNGHIGEDDKLERLQLMSEDGSDVVEIGDDLTLGDILLLAPDRRINAVVWSPPPPYVPPPVDFPCQPPPMQSPLPPPPPPSSEGKKRWILDWSWCWK
ncbi:hypothetical protein CBR_g23844 [Chara braunii]|uniref:Uncharacterized protein n=1 Tax=Chara braunii TaxID=69332 RepID=A0A388JVP4_CHABU|nr:hypothetical protein CBR_g23844 [Chara braunii]|eukprot:GBG61894.1 hypothetical protein CBR_g23844 [Chara braunii]